MSSKDHKWFFSISPNQAAQEAACEVLGTRAATVLHYAKKAIDGDRDEVETVHQLRVATRRMAAALRVFEGHVPERVCGRIKRANSRLRRVAADVRDLDVKVPLLRERLTTCQWVDAQLAESLLEAVDRRHARAHGTFDDEIESRARKYAKRVKQLEKCLNREAKSKRGQSGVFSDLVHEHLRKSWEAVKASSAVDLNDVENLHQFRISCKRLRYCLEIASSCVDGEAREELYQTLRDFQGRLGHINDLRNLYSLLAGLRADVLDRNSTRNRPAFALQYDRLTATIAFEWFELHRSLVGRWSAIGRIQLESQVQRLWSPRSERRDGKSRTRAIGFPISGATVTPIISRDAE